jgi:hypothetical protein
MHAALVTFFEIPFEKKRRRQATYRLLSINRNIQYIPLVMDPHYIADDTYMRTLEDEEFVLRERDISLHKKKIIWRGELVVIFPDLSRVRGYMIRKRGNICILIELCVQYKEVLHCVICYHNRTNSIIGRRADECRASIDGVQCKTRGQTKKMGFWNISV